MNSINNNKPHKKKGETAKNLVASKSRNSKKPHTQDQTRLEQSDDSILSFDKMDQTIPNSKDMKLNDTHQIKNQKIDLVSNRNFSENINTKDLVKKEFYLETKNVAIIDNLITKSERPNDRNKKVSDSVEMQNRY